MTTKDRPAAVARALTGAGTAIAMIGMITGFQLSAAAAEQQAQVDAAAAVATTTTSAVRGQAVRVLDPTLLPEIVVAAPVAAAVPSSSGTRSGSSAAAPAAPAPPAPAPAPAQPAPPANGTTAGSGG